MGSLGCDVEINVCGTESRTLWGCHSRRPTRLAASGDGTCFHGEARRGRLRHENTLGDGGSSTLQPPSTGWDG